MPDKKGRLSDKEHVFVKALVATGDTRIAAKEAGYRFAKNAASEVSSRPAIQAEVARQSAERITNHLLPLAVNAIERLLVDPKTPAGATVQAAKLVMDRVYGGENAMLDKPPAEMTGDELARALEQLRMQAAKRSGNVIDAEPVTETQSAGVFE